MLLRDSQPEPFTSQSGPFLSNGVTQTRWTSGHGGRVVALWPHTSEARGSVPGTASSGKVGSCLPLVGSLQYRTLRKSMYWFPLPFQLPVVI